MMIRDLQICNRSATDNKRYATDNKRSANDDKGSANLQYICY